VDPGRAVVGRQLAGLDSLRQPGRAAAAQPCALGVLGAGGQVPVKEHGHPGVLADERGRRQRLGRRRTAALAVEPDDRHHVERPHVRMHAVVGAHVDVRNRGLGEADEPL
jgi:hypothetical protein